MAQKTDIRLRRSDTAGKIPTSANLSDGELAINTNSGALYFKKSNGTIITVHDNTILHIDSDTTVDSETGSNPKVGIGTTSPDYALDIRDNTNIQLKLSSIGASANARMTYAVNNTQKWNHGVQAADDMFTFYDIVTGTIPFKLEQGAAQNTLVVDSNSRVGIGTAVPARNLHIHEGDSTLSYIQITNTTTGATSTDGVSFGITSDEEAAWINREDTDTFISTNNTERVRIKNNGDVGIGTNAPARKLHVESDGQLVVAKFESGNNGGALIDIENDATLASSAGAFAGLRFYNDSGFEMALTHITESSGNGYVQIGTAWASGGEKLVVHSNGNVGIGTTSPDAQLEVESSGTGRIAISGTVGANLQFRPNTSYTAGGNFGIYTTGLTSGTYESTMTIKGYGSGVNDVMTIKGLGNVGIGTTTPSELLEVAGDAKVTNLGVNAGPQDYLSSLSARLVVGGNVVINNNSPILYLRANSSSNNSDLRFQYGLKFTNGAGTIQAIIDSGGRVGIKNSSPSSQYFNTLVVGDTSGEHGITIQSGATNRGVLAFSDTDSATAGRYDGYIAYNHNSTYMSFHTNTGNEHMRIDSVGRVLINTTSSVHSAAKLQVVGDTSSFARVALKDADGSSNIAYIDKEGAQLGFTSQNGTSHGTIALKSYDGTSTLNRLTIDQNGAITFNEAFTFPNSIGSAGQVLKVPNSGTTLQWADETGGGGSTDSITDADGDTKIQVEESADEDVIRFDVAGSEIGTMTDDGVILNDGYNFEGGLIGCIKFKAQAGEALTTGDVVYISGISGNTVIVSKADADDSSKMPAFGLAGKTVSLNAAVPIVTFGTLQGVDTSTPNYSIGDELYVSTTAGALTNSAPTGSGSLLQKIGKVTRVDTNAGSIKVQGAGRTNATPNLDEGRLFVGNSSNQSVQGDDTLYVDMANSRVGINTTSPDKPLDVLGDIRSIDGSSNQHQLRATQVISYGTDAILNAQSTGDDVRLNTQGTTRLIATAEGNVGIGTSSPAGNLHVKSVGNIGDALLIVEADADNNVESDNPRIELRQDSNLVSGALYLEGNAGTTATNALQNSLLLDAKGGSSDGGTIQFATGGLAANQSGGPTNSAVRMTILRDGNVGIGTIAPSGKLHIIHDDTSDALLLETTESSSSAAPVLTFKRNSTSVADADYLGQLKFKGENDADQEVVYAKITSKIQDASDGSEDGLIEFANKKAGSNVITARLRSDSLQLLNGTGLEVAGDATITGNLTVDGTTTTLNTATLDVEDKNITLNYGSGDTSASADGAGITIQDAVDSSTNATILWDGTNDEFDFSHKINVNGNILGSGVISLTGTSGSTLYALELTRSAGGTTTPDLWGQNGTLVLGTSSTTEALAFSSADSIFYGDLTIPNKIRHSGDTDTYISFANADDFRIVVGNSTRAAFNTSKIHFNQEGISQDFQVESNNNQNMLFVDASSDRVGIGTSSPERLLHIDGSSGLLINDSATHSATKTAFIPINNSGNSLLKVKGGNFIHTVAYETSWNDFEYAKLVSSYNTSDSRFDLNKSASDGSTAATTRISTGTSFFNGDVGIGDTTPTARLNVNSGTENTIALFESSDSLGRLIIKDSSGEVHLNNVGNDFSVRTSSAGSTKLTVKGDTGNVGIGEASPKAKLQVEELGIDTTETTTSATTQVTLASLSITDFRSARFTIQVTNSTDSTYHTTELLAVHDGTTAYITEFGEIHTGSAEEATFDATITSGFFRLQATPASTDTMVFKVISYAITV